MSDERFYLGNNGTTICDRSQGGSDGFNMLTIFKVVDLLNEQQATINNFEKLFSETIGVADTSKLLETGDYEIKRMVVKELIENLQKENEQLRQQHQRLYNYFRDYLEDEMSAENFGEMWDNVKEDERWNDE